MCQNPAWQLLERSWKGKGKFKAEDKQWGRKMEWGEVNVKQKLAWENGKR